MTPAPEAPRSRWPLAAYEMATMVVAVCAAPFAMLALLFRPQWRAGIGERFGRIPVTPASR